MYVENVKYVFVWPLPFLVEEAYNVSARKVVITTKQWLSFCAWEAVIGP